MGMPSSISLVMVSIGLTGDRQSGEKDDQIEFVSQRKNLNTNYHWCRWDTSSWIGLGPRRLRCKFISIRSENENIRQLELPEIFKVR